MSRTYETDKDALKKDYESLIQNMKEDYTKTIKD